MSSQDSQFHQHFTELNDNDFEIHGSTLVFIIILFSIVILTVLLFLCVRWLCRCQRHHFPSHQLHAPPPPPQSLHPTIIRALPITLYQSSSPSSSTLNPKNHSKIETECCICLGVFEDGDKVKVLPNCEHIFHSECVDRWLVTQSSCPLCRASIITILTDDRRISGIHLLRRIAVPSSAGLAVYCGVIFICLDITFGPPRMAIAHLCFTSAALSFIFLIFLKLINFFC